MQLERSWKRMFTITLKIPYLELQSRCFQVQRSAGKGTFSVFELRRRTRGGVD